MFSYIFALHSSGLLIMFDTVCVTFYANNIVNFSECLCETTAVCLSVYSVVVIIRIICLLCFSAVYRLLTAKLSFSMFVEVCTYTTVSHFFLQRELTSAKFIVELLLTPYLFWANSVYS